MARRRPKSDVRTALTLEATQARRLGAPTPLARVQLYGLPGS